MDLIAWPVRQVRVLVYTTTCLNGQRLFTSNLQLVKCRILKVSFIFSLVVFLTTSYDGIDFLCWWIDKTTFADDFREPIPVSKFCERQLTICFLVKYWLHRALLSH